jgi:hypothetical protein
MKKLLTNICAITLAMVVFLTTIPMMGCTSSELKADTTVLATALTSLATAMQTSDSATAAKLTAAATSLNAVVKNWDTSTATSTINTIAAGVETTLAEIPSTSSYAALVAIAVAAVDAIIASTSTSSTKVSAKPLSAKAQGQLGYYRLFGRAQLNHKLARSNAGDFKAAWNTAISAYQLNVTPLK